MPGYTKPITTNIRSGKQNYQCGDSGIFSLDGDAYSTINGSSMEEIYINRTLTLDELKTNALWDYNPTGGTPITGICPWIGYELIKGKDGNATKTDITGHMTFDHSNEENPFWCFKGPEGVCPSDCGPKTNCVKDCTIVEGSQITCSQKYQSGGHQCLYEDRLCTAPTDGTSPDCSGCPTC
tara:strand:- start:788 stop:1330 length:543 start_codon:yes stop_codon:yes gene_type:complete